MSADLLFELWARVPKTGELTARLGAEMPLPHLLDDLRNIVEGHGNLTLENYAVVAPTRRVARPAAMLWELRENTPEFITGYFETAGTPLRRVSADVVVSELINDQIEHNHPSNTPGQVAAMAMQQTLRASIALIEALGFVVAKEEL